MDYTVRVAQPSEQVIPNLISALQSRNLQATVSFDLRLARAGQDGCDCPYHGRADCACQYAILLVYDPAQTTGAYRSITVHGRDETVWLTLLQSSAPAIGRSTYEAMETALLNILLGLVASSQQVVGAETGEPVFDEA